MESNNDKMLAIDPLHPKCMSEVLELLRNKPAMYLGRKSLHDLRSWLDGFQYAIFINDGTALKMDVDLSAFDTFIQDHYDWHDVGGWSAKIMYYNRIDTEAFDEFFKLYDEFRLINSKE